MCASCNCSTVPVPYCKASFPTQTLQVRPPTYSAVCVFPVGPKVLLHLEPQSNKKGETHCCAIVQLRSLTWLHGNGSLLEFLQNVKFLCGLGLVFIRFNIFPLFVICFPAFF